MSNFFNQDKKYKYNYLLLIIIFNEDYVGNWAQSPIYN